MQMRRFTRATNAFSKRVAMHADVVAQHFMGLQLLPHHETLLATPAMEAGVTDRLREMGDVELVRYSGWNPRDGSQLIAEFPSPPADPIWANRVQNRAASQPHLQAVVSSHSERGSPHGRQQRHSAEPKPRARGRTGRAGNVDLWLVRQFEKGGTADDAPRARQGAADLRRPLRCSPGCSDFRPHVAKEKLAMTDAHDPNRTPTRSEEFSLLRAPPRNAVCPVQERTASHERQAGRHKEQALPARQSGRSVTPHCGDS